MPDVRAEGSNEQLPDEFAIELHESLDEQPEATGNIMELEMNRICGE